ncbi:iron uptake porin [Geitlerinema sp. PCC 7407]|uniref:iron uptake porin n=1 Tax=Geitlerinema sp. PCC 7407 TaxID=1173025 RepID=UPI00029F8422|nr:iron uptake porin [Geitlerinema sp. PCC 7407]AFY67452.1 cyanobacterial porin [Geitlerinema sp. PCC 7407]
MMNAKIVQVTGLGLSMAGAALAAPGAIAWEVSSDPASQLPSEVAPDIAQTAEAIAPGQLPEFAPRPAAPEAIAQSLPADPVAMDQVTSVSQLSDVQPTDWAFQALQSLVERYGCIAGYPDGTYRGNRAMTRYEFAAGLNACLDRVNELIAAGTADLATREDLATLQRLQEEFAAELATLRGRVDSLEARTAELEANQFSTTTKLVGEAIFAASGAFGSDLADDSEVVFQERIRLDLQSSFTGRDLLHTRLAAGNGTPFRIGTLTSVDGASTAESTQIFNPGDTGNGVILEWLSYSFPLSDKLQVYIDAAGGTHADYAPTINPYLEDFDGGRSTSSAFGQESPIYRIGGGAGAAMTYQLNDSIGFSLGYLADNAASPEGGSGLFNGDYATLAQLTLTPGDRLQLGLTYVHGYHRSNNPIFDIGIGTALTGTIPANFPSAELSPTVSNSYGVQASYQFSPKFVVNGFFGHTDVRIVKDPFGTGIRDGEVWYYGLGLAFPDLGKEGNLGGIVVGVQPYLGGYDNGPSLSSIGIDNKTSLHVEGFYRYQLNDNISVTPGVIWLTDPGQFTGDRDDVVIGTLRTTFNF